MTKRSNHRILVTGSDGFIGNALCRFLAARGHEVIGTTRRRADGSTDDIARLPFVLGGSLQPSWFETELPEFRVVVHLAHDFTSGHLSANVEGTRALASAAVRAGVARQIFISSYSATPTAPTEYGRAKFTLEEILRPLGCEIVRPGLVVGAGGLFGRIIELIRRSPVVPILGSRRNLLPVVALADVLASVERIALSGPTTEEVFANGYNLWNEPLISLRDLVAHMCRTLHLKRHLVQVPIPLLLPPLELAERLGIRLPITTENVRAFAANQGNRSTSNLHELLGSVTSIDDMITAALNREQEEEICRYSAQSGRS